MKFNRKQELYLMEAGLRQVINDLMSSSKTSKKWTKSQRNKFSQTIKKKWASRKKKSD